MTILIRLQLAILALVQAIVGFWNQVFPESFYRDFPTVDLSPGFSEHFARDFGGATLGLALILAIACVRPHAAFVIPAALAYSLYSIPHFLFHVQHLEGASPIEGVGLTAANAIMAIMGLTVIALTPWRDRRAARRAGGVAGA